MEAVATARVADRKKKRPVAGAGQYVLKRIHRGPRDDFIQDSPQAELVAILASSLGVVPLAIPLAGAGSSRPTCFEPSGSHLPESA